MKNRDSGESSSSTVLSQMDVVLLERIDAGQFRPPTSAPAWFNAVFGEATSLSPIQPGRRSLFLGHFLEDAEVFWSAAQPEQWISSGTFNERLPDGGEKALEAIALVASGTPILLIKSPTTDHETVRDLLQKSRSQSIEYGRMIKEINKREVLLHCIVHDLSTPLAGVKGSLELMKADDLLLPDGARLQQIGMNQVLKMQNMIQEILHAFKAEVKGLVPTVIDRDAGPDALSCAREVTTALSGLARDVAVGLRVEEDASVQDFSVSADQSRLERVIFNLVDNAIRFAPPGSDVIVKVRSDGEWIEMRIEDAGPGVEPSLRPRLFQRFEQGDSGKGSAGLGLYFCRITVADWGGSIGYDDRPQGGASFWLKLPKPRT
ncbi:MAG: HAMP domain-containing histidine kinase [Bacteroidetes bacterium]|nr:HAMP domain-containing histidine kinase [Bacteroidota bacterium]